MVSPPSDLAVTVISSSRINITWKNNDNYDWIRVYRGKGNTEGDAIAALDAYKRILPSEYMEDSGLETDEWYAYKIFGSVGHPLEDSDFSNIDAGETLAALAAPTLVVATPISDTKIDITFKDNSSEEKWHRVQRKLGAGAYGNVVDLEPNREFYRDTGLAADSLYTYKVHAMQEEGDLGNYALESAQVVTFDVPTAPVLAAILDADTQDKSIRVRWPGVVEGLWKTATLYHVNDWVTNDGISYICIHEHTSDDAKKPGIGIGWIAEWEVVTGYKIEQDKDAEGYAEIAKIGAGINNFLAIGLTPSATYSFKIIAYNAAGDSGYSNIVSKDALSAYVPTEFEKWIRDPNIEPVYLAEIYTKMTLTGFELESGVVWKKTIGASDRGIDIDKVFEDGDAYLEKTSVATVQAKAESFWFDYDSRILYIHTTGGANPNTFDLIEGAFWLYFSTHKDKEFAAIDQISPCDATTGWSGESLSIDTDDKKEGTGSLKDTIASPSSPTTYQTIYNPIGTWDWSAKKHILFWLKSDRANIAFAEARLYILDSSGNYRFWSLIFSAGEWTPIKELLSAGDGESGTPPDLASINEIRVHFRTADTTPFYKKIDDVRVVGRLNHFLPLLAKEDIPDITQEIKPYFEGSFGIASGSIAFANAKIGGEHFFDKKFAAYTWINAKVILKAGSDAFIYGDFKEIFTAYVNEKSCSDTKIVFQLRDMRSEMSQSISLNKFNTTDYPDIDEMFIGKLIPAIFGFRDLTIPIPIDMENQHFKFNDSSIAARSGSVERVEKNDAELTEDTHYYIDLQRSIITFERDGRFIITAANKKIDFKEGAGGELTATLTENTYTTAGLCAEIQAKMRAAGSFLYVVGPTDIPATPPKKFTIAAGADEVFSLLWKTGTNGADGTDTNIGTTIGFSDDEDSEGEDNYEADDDMITIQKGDIIRVSCKGFVNSADETIDNGAEIFKYLMNNYKGIQDSELNLDSIYATKSAKPNVLALPIESEPSFDEIVRTIEHSMEAYTFQDELGRLGIKPQQTVIASNVKYVISKQIFDHTQSKDRSTLFWKVNVYYNKDYDDNWEVKTATKNEIKWQYRVTKILPIDTYFTSSSHAADLAASILSLLNKEQIENELPMLLFDVMAGDLVVFSRTRFYNLAGTANEITLRINKISKSPGSGRTSITAEAI